MDLRTLILEADRWGPQDKSEDPTGGDRVLAAQKHAEWAKELVDLPETEQVGEEDQKDAEADTQLEDSEIDAAEESTEPLPSVETAMEELATELPGAENADESQIQAAFPQIESAADDADPEPEEIAQEIQPSEQAGADFGQAEPDTEPTTPDLSETGETDVVDVIGQQSAIQAQEAPDLTLPDDSTHAEPLPDLPAETLDEPDTSALSDVAAAEDVWQNPEQQSSESDPSPPDANQLEPLPESDAAGEIAEAGDPDTLPETDQQLSDPDQEPELPRTDQASDAFSDDRQSEPAPDTFDDTARDVPESDTVDATDLAEQFAEQGEDESPQATNANAEPDAWQSLESPDPIGDETPDEELSDFGGDTAPDDIVAPPDPEDVGVAESPQVPRTDDSPDAEQQSAEKIESDQNPADFGSVQEPEPVELESLEEIQGPDEFSDGFGEAPEMEPVGLQAVKENVMTADDFWQKDRGSVGETASQQATNRAMDVHEFATSVNDQLGPQFDALRDFMGQAVNDAMTYQMLLLTEFGDRF